MFFTRRNPFVQFKTLQPDQPASCGVFTTWCVVSHVLSRRADINRYLYMSYQRLYSFVKVGRRYIILSTLAFNSVTGLAATGWLVVTLSVFFVDVISGQVRSHTASSHGYARGVWTFLYSHMASHFFIFFWNDDPDTVTYVYREQASLHAGRTVVALSTVIERAVDFHFFFCFFW